MAKATRQVHKRKNNTKISTVKVRLTPEERLAIERAVHEQAEAEGYPTFLRPSPDGRRYPGEAEAFYLLTELRHLEDLSDRKKLEALLKPLRELNRCVQSFERGNTAARAKAIKTKDAICSKLTKTITSGRVFALDVRRDGLVIEPTTSEGLTALALLSLFYQGKLSGIRQCLHCRTWFYARFKHQRFCRFYNCQWRHYHSPEWRKQHRERNRQHQIDYRKRLFTKADRVKKSDPQ
jgi:hypothetical protein